MSSVYNINKGINQPIEFKGLKAQYIWWLCGGLVCLLILFAVMYILGLNMYLCIGIIGILGVVLFVIVYKMNSSYGEYGLMKKVAGRSVPRHLRRK
jgi:predicted lysophospholipase L1 biosynthesis ABC-type transport system permease subunit